jgi:CheY-like chemotaxis protein
MNGMLTDAFAAGATRVFNKSSMAVMQNVVAAFAEAFCPAPFSSAPLETDHPLHAPRKPASPENNPILIPSCATGQTNIYVRSETTFFASHDDTEMIAAASEIFYESSLETISGIRSSLRGYSKAAETKSGAAHLSALYRKIHAVTGAAGVAHLETFSNFSACLEAYLRELLANPAAFQSSTLRTLAAAIDLMGDLFAMGSNFSCPLPAEPAALVVDDDPISRRAVTFGLDKARIKSTAVADARSALAEAARFPYEVIFLDVDLPQTNGFDLCGLIRQMPLYESVPVVFVTGLRDFQTRARSTACHASDFISKPLSFLELAVKSLTLLIKGRLLQPVAPPLSFVT